MNFEQAAIKVEREQEFGQLKDAISRAFAPETVEKFLRKLASKKVRVRDWDAVLAKRLLENAVATSAESVDGLYRSLTLSDQAQIREYYLFRVEEVESGLRAKFHKVYQYY
jgi:hypothetical protein